MNEKTELLKAEHNEATLIKDIWENPVVKFVLDRIRFMSPDISYGVDKLLEMHQRKKLEELFEILLKDNTVTIEDISNVDCIMEIAKTMEVVNRLIRNDKVKYLANLLKSSIKDENRNIDEFEELLSKLSTLSLREIELLYLLYNEEQKVKQLDEDEKEVFNPKKSWEAFTNKVGSEYELNESEIISLMLGIMRTGFCVGEWRTYLSVSATLVMYTSPEYKKLLKKIYD